MRDAIIAVKIVAVLVGLWLVSGLASFWIDQVTAQEKSDLKFTQPAFLPLLVCSILWLMLGYFIGRTGAMKRRKG